MSARFVEHVVPSQRQKRREVYVSMLVARALTRNSAARARAGESVETVSDGELQMAGGRMLSNLREVYQTLQVGSSRVRRSR